MMLNLLVVLSGLNYSGVIHYSSHNVKMSDEYASADVKAAE